MTKVRIHTAFLFAMSFLIALVFPTLALAHCDSLDGPVILEARAALEKQDVTPLLKWVKASDEAELRAAFDRTLVVRQLGAQAKTLADTWFFETLVRIHRAGEGAPYTGLKPAGSILPPIQEADRALQSGSVDKLAKTLSEHTAAGLRERFTHAVEARAHAAENAEAGRKFVEAYVSYVHYVEALAEILHGSGHHAGGDRHP